MTATTYRVALVPRDGLFCKDGRGWHTSESGRGHALDWPWPSTVRGALLTARGRAEEAATGKLKTREEWLSDKANGAVTLGVTLPLRSPVPQPGQAATDKWTWGQAHRVWPTPGDALWAERLDKVVALDPQEPVLPTMGRDDDAAREALWAPRLTDMNKPRSAPRWLDEADFLDWLCGPDIAAKESKYFRNLNARVQAHVGIYPATGTNEDGILFTHDVVEFLEKTSTDEFAEWAIAAEVEVRDGQLPDTATLGSDGRMVALDQCVAADIFEAPKALTDAFATGSAGLRLIVVTPARFENGWLPDGFGAVGKSYRGTVQLSEGQVEVILRAAFVGRPHHVSGWDLAAREPKNTDRLVPPGSTYFFERADGKAFTAGDATNLWLAPFGARIEEGFGRVVPGVWQPKKAVQ
ncbi:MAG: hypothetical protein KDK28_06440 [Maritimibacter sp.]|nr:hypothetical protein [Maritimibacter sp.]